MVSLALISCLLAITLAATLVDNDPKSDTWFEGTALLSGEKEETFLLTLSDLEKREPETIIQRNISETFVSPSSMQCILSIDAQIQKQPDAEQPICTLQICLASGTCSVSKALTHEWETFTLVKYLLANETQTAAFVTSCVGPATIALRGMTLPGRYDAGTTTIVPDTQARISGETQPAMLQISTASEQILAFETVSSATETLPSELTPMQTWGVGGWTYVSAHNGCPNNSVILVSTPKQPDLTVLTSDAMSGFSPDFDNASATFYHLDEYRLCAAFTGRSDEAVCGTAPLTLGNITTGDTIELTCPDAAPARQKPSQSIPLKIRIETTCQTIAGQIGCSQGGYCQGFSHELYSSVQDIELPYPLTSPPERLRVKTLTYYTESQWLVSFGGEKVLHPQSKGQWLEIMVPDSATTIDLEAFCEPTITSDPSAEPSAGPSAENRTTARVANYCEDNKVFLSTTDKPDLSVLGSNYPYSFDMNPSNASATFEPLGGSLICATRRSSSEVVCGDDAFTIANISDKEVIRLECPDKTPAQLDPPNSIPLKVLLGDCGWSIVVQSGCHQGEYCKAFEEYGWGSFSSYDTVGPLISPTERLRVRILGPEDVTEAQWLVHVGFGGEEATFPQPRGQWIEIPIPDGATVLGLEASCKKSPAVEPPSETYPGFDLWAKPRGFWINTFSECEQDYPITQEVPWTSVRSVLEPMTSGRLRIYSNRPWFEFQKVGQFCVTNNRTSARECGSGFVNLYDVASEDRFNVECEVSEPSLEVQVLLVNRCSSFRGQSQDTFIVGSPNHPDGLLLGSQERVQANLSSDRPEFTFESSSGRAACATSRMTGARHCGVTFTVANVTHGDSFDIECNGEYPSDYWLSNAPGIPLTIGYIAPPCSDFVVQIGCEEGTPCSASSGSQTQVLTYPLVSPAARLRVKTIDGEADTAWGFKQYVNGIRSSTELFTQKVGDWLEIAVSPNTTEMRLSPTCKYTAPPPREPWKITVKNDCETDLTPIMVTQPGIQVDGVIFSGSTTVSLDVWSDEAFISFQEIARDSLCVQELNGASTSCTGWYGEPATFHVSRDQQELSVTCPYQYPSEHSTPDMNNTRPFSIFFKNENGTGGSVPCHDLVVQIGCDPYNFCMDYGYPSLPRDGEKQHIDFEYPLFPSPARLRVKLGAGKAQWRLEYTSVRDFEETVLDQLRGDWLDVTEYIANKTLPGTSFNMSATCYEE